jgi:hypothetical protein
MGPGYAANVCIGRAIRLILLNGGGALPSRGYDKATHGSPTKFGLCFAENEEASPFAPFRTQFGVDQDFTTVTIAAAESTHNINDHGSRTADSLLKNIAGTMTTTGNNNLYWNGDTFVVICPEHADILAKGGFNVQSLKHELYRRVRVPVSTMSPGQFEHFKTMALGNTSIKEEDYVDPDGRVAIVPRPDDIKIIVAGGEGKHCVWIPTFGLSWSVTQVIKNSKNEPVRRLSDF